MRLNIRHREKWIHFKEIFKLFITAHYNLDNSKIRCLIFQFYRKNQRVRPQTIDINFENKFIIKELILLSLLDELHTYYR